ncbi:lytic murein transglycosylase [Salipiger mucosus]|uniref:Membrane-bound lytic murein transglycosylase B n=1 Tax=Salipiger mucosus DSM 16094 TaxID=1123237 RepID=S9S9P7_9RHOB|nr:lytic murein transglycosylase [Salipiger mucosus]EPX82984.1 Membrane-bound lytic murein transglycosylase B precursor [Salipiger mucosus DSM 16094]
MAVTRRWMMTAATALVAGCGGTARMAGVSAPAADPELQPQPNPGWDAWVARFRERAGARGISGATLDGAFRGAGFLPGVVERDRNQTEFTRTLEDYLAITASETKVATGRDRLRARMGLLREIVDRYGVPPEVVAAVWGMESNYGARRGNIPVISSTSTLAFDGRRGAFFEAQLMSALRLLERGDTTPSRLVGSWAGAMGHTQFIPTTYQEYAVDFRGDGRRDIWSEDPTDGLASTANYLSRSGWRRGQPWGLEVGLPDDFPAGLAGRGTTRSSGQWAALGVTPVGGGALPDAGPGSVLMPSGRGGPAFLVFRNFGVILRYNNSENYGIGVGHLSDRLLGGGPLRGTFPPDRFGLTIEDRKELQRRLTSAGFDAGTPDGVLGSRTEAAIEAYQARAGLPITGEPSRGLLTRLRG